MVRLFIETIKKRGQPHLPPQPSGLRLGSWSLVDGDVHHSITGCSNLWAALFTDLISWKMLQKSKERMADLISATLAGMDQSEDIAEFSRSY